MKTECMAHDKATRQSIRLTSQTSHHLLSPVGDILLLSYAPSVQDAHLIMQIGPMFPHHLRLRRQYPVCLPSFFQGLFSRLQSVLHTSHGKHCSFQFTSILIPLRSEGFIRSSHITSFLQHETKGYQQLSQYTLKFFRPLPTQTVDSGLGDYTQWVH